ncbi:MAG: hypothetical protein GWN55_13100 [Phycisphaerae bacterium]|nr:hypothetical protein [Phycisphaerae bacterium]NIP51039.1 hypothetical protein [Phycisphaerae bacterium]NIS50259.1 hypothetical protein [Phycisphaerae bacterium]NIV02234.1 hypothetical protein [Phycisphaerae bacterium]NIV70666.1 hypothetical protein [Phycisphaerae bacterium]
MSKAVEQWAPFVAANISPELVPVILAIIENESGGQAGIPSYAATKFHEQIPSRSGGSVLVDRAYGLMQVIPVVYLDYNRKHTDKIYWEDISGTSKAAGQAQIKAGIWTFLNNVRAIEAFTGQKLVLNGQLNWDLLNLVLISYAWGIGRVRKKLTDLIERNLAPTFDNIKSLWPELGLPANQPLVYAGRIYNKALKYGGQVWEAVEETVSQFPVKETAGGAALALAVGFILLQMFKAR